MRILIIFLLFTFTSLSQNNINITKQENNAMTTTQIVTSLTTIYFSVDGNDVNYKRGLYRGFMCGLVYTSATILINPAANTMYNHIGNISGLIISYGILKLYQYLRNK